MYYATTDGKNVKVFRENGQIVRQFRPGGMVMGVQANDNSVAIMLDNGRTVVYRIDGTIVRKTKM